MREKYGSARVGEPKATAKRTVDELKADNIIGIYVDMGVVEDVDVLPGESRIA